MSNCYMSDHTPMGGGGFPLKGMDVTTVSLLGEGSVLGQGRRALTSSPENEVRGKFSPLSAS